MTTPDNQQPSAGTHSVQPLVSEPCRTYQDLIDKTHPMEDGAGESELAADALAMKLVGERHSKRDLVDLVRWLILRKPDGLTQARQRPGTQGAPPTKTL